MTNQRRIGRPLFHIGQLLVALGLLAACTSTADIFPLNASARAIGDPDIKFVREGIDQGPVTATMPDGEVLHGHYRVARDGGMVMAFSGGQTATAIGEGGGGVQFVLRGPRTEMLCRGLVSFGGHGNGQCETEDGALWAVSYFRRAARKTKVPSRTVFATATGSSLSEIPTMRGSYCEDLLRRRFLRTVLGT